MSDSSNTDATDSVRLDVWLWATRLSKSRSMATDACKLNRVQINGQNAKPSRQVRIGDRIEFRKGALTRTVEVKDLLTKRVGAKLVDDFLIDHTPESEYEKAAEIGRENRQGKPKREAGAGRPTKKDRRELEEIMQESETEMSAFEAFAKAMKKNINLILISAGAFLIAAGTATAQEPAKRTFKVKEGVPVLNLSETLIVHAQKISPEKNPETGALTAMAATGDVLIKVKPKGAKDWILVACDKAVYDSVADTIKLTGNPAVKSGAQTVRATDAKTYVSIERKTGKWQINGPNKMELDFGAFKKRK